MWVKIEEMKKNSLVEGQVFIDTKEHEMNPKHWEIDWQQTIEWSKI